MSSIVQVGGRYVTVEGDQVSHEEIMSFVMPKPGLGQQVIWYQTGIPDRRRATVGFVCYVGGRNVGIILAGGQRVEAVRHVSDPKLRINQDQRDAGAWDFPEDFYRTRERLDKIEGLLEQIAIKVGVKKKRPDESAKQADKPKKRKQFSEGQLASVWLKRKLAEAEGKPYSHYLKYKLNDLLDEAYKRGLLPSEVQSRPEDAVAWCAEQEKQRRLSQ